MSEGELIQLLVSAIENNVESWDMVGDIAEALDKGHAYLGVCNNTTPPPTTARNRAEREVR